jgi:hypothetical protein
MEARVKIAKPAAKTVFAPHLSPHAPPRISKAEKG